MKLPNFRRIMDTDYAEEYKGLVRQLAVSINYGFEVLYQALNKRLTLAENIQCTVRDITLKINDNGVPQTDTQMQLDVPNVRVIGTTVIDVVNNENSSSYPDSAVFVFYTQNPLKPSKCCFTSHIR